jgi:hypothetical protein
MVPKDDWRRTDQEEYLTGIPLKFMARYPKGPLYDHDHCEFCFQEISMYEGATHCGYCTLDEYRWICPACYEDFREEFGWTLEGESPCNTN